MLNLTLIILTCLLVPVVLYLLIGYLAVKLFTRGQVTRNPMEGSIQAMYSLLLFFIWPYVAYRMWQDGWRPWGKKPKE